MGEGGIAAAVGNALFAATGRRLRELPFRLEWLDSGRMEPRKARVLLLDTRSYGGRSTSSRRLPGAVIDGMRYVL